MDKLRNASVEELVKLREEIAKEQRKLDADKKAFELMIEHREQSLKQNEVLFEQKWRLLEEETRRLAEEQKKFQRRQQFFNRVSAYVEDGQKQKSNIVNGEMFFQGVANGQALKKRYKDLIKIYHPDSGSGDNVTVQEINREYDNLRRAMAE